MLKCSCENHSECTCEHGVVCLKNVTYRRQDRMVLEGITFCIDEGIFLGIIGPNGGGKTTLLRLVLGDLALQEGRIQVFGKTPEQLATQRSLIGYVPQRHEIEKNFPVTALDVVLMGATSKVGLFRRIPQSVRERAEALLERAGVAELRDRPIGRMSGGQQQRTFIARALISEPKLLILDEPTVGIDSHGQQQFLQLVRNLKSELNLTVIMVSHDVGQLAFYSDQIACLNQKLHWHNRAELLNEEVLQHVYECEMDAYRERVKEIAVG